jgi:hypothetical protein
MALRKQNFDAPDEQPPNPEAFEGLQRIRKLIMQDRQGKPFEDSTEMIRQMREERSRYLEELGGLG